MVLRRLIVILLFALCGASASAEGIAPARLDAARAALAAATANDRAQLEQALATLGDDFPLASYVSYRQLLARLPEASLDDILGWLRRHRDHPLADHLRHAALDHFGARRDWSSFLAVSHGVPGNTHLRCYYYRALQDQDREEAIRGARSLWLSGESRPDSCDPLFSWLRREGQLDDRLVQERMLLAFRADNVGLMRYLRSLLQDRRARDHAALLLRLHGEPEHVRALRPERHPAWLVLAGLHRLADRNPVMARKLAPLMAERYAFSDADLDTVLARAAWFSVIRDIRPNRAWLDDYLAGSTSLRLLEQRIRAAVREEQWEDVLTWTERLPMEHRNAARWQYWRARALESLGRADEATRALEAAAGERTFWGFLAAQELGLPYRLNDQPPAWREAPRDAATRDALDRVRWLLALGETAAAREEWLHLLRKAGEEDFDALASEAMRRGWHHFAVSTALFAGRRNVLDWRFPVALRDAFVQAAGETGVDPWLLMAVARRESAFNPDARSPVGARGLMQLMPYTAAQVAQELALPAPADADLADPMLNLRLGSHYLAGLLKRYSGNRILALAAYNAGPHRVDQWLEEREMPFDVFIESIPFYETREYVQAVLAYRVILSRHEDADQLAALMLPHERGLTYSPLMLARTDD